MRYAVLYNVFCCFMVTLIGAATARHILLYRDRGPADRHFAWFWIFGAALWFFAGVRLLFYHAGMLAFDRFVFYVVQIFVVLHIAPAVGHTIAKLTDHRRLNAATQLFSFLFYLAFLWYAFRDGIVDEQFTRWGSEYTISPDSFYAFFTALSFCVAGNTYDLLRRATARLFGREAWSVERAAASASLVIYIGAGGADTKGVTADWVLIAIRAVYMLAALVAYTAYTWETSPALLRHTVERSDL